MSNNVRKTAAELKQSAARRRRPSGNTANGNAPIDLSDIPELHEAFWSNAVQNPFYRPVKKQITLRLDADVIAWLRENGKGYQTRTNSILREFMLRERRRQRG